MDSNFTNDEALYRAIRPLSMFWRSDGSLTSAAFKDKNGLSVDRGNYRSDTVVVTEMKKMFDGAIAKLYVKNCLEVEANVVYDPTENNLFHSLILGKTKQELSGGQSKALSRICEIVYRE